MPASTVSRSSFSPELKVRSKFAAKIAPSEFSKSPTGTRDHARIDAAFNGRKPSDLVDEDAKAIAKALSLSVSRVVNSIAAAIVQDERDPEFMARVAKLPVDSLVA
jgi:hypothetical protein